MQLRAEDTRFIPKKEQLSSNSDFHTSLCLLNFQEVHMKNVVQKGVQRKSANNLIFVSKN